MKARFPALLLAATFAASGFAAPPPATPASQPVLVIHGGAGTIVKEQMSAEVERQYREKLSEALLAGHAILKAGGTSLDAIVAAIRVMEESPLFNAGRGAVFTHEGRNELDASIMDGKTRAAGAVAGVTIVKSPIVLARTVMEKSPHVLLTGKGAEMFATEQGLEIVDPSWFWTERRWKQLQDLLVKDKEAEAGHFLGEERKFGTVGAVALDSHGNLAAGTSTGGMTNKRWGRVGDSPIIGAGTFADNSSCAVSSTGHGEFFIRWVAAYDVAALMKYRGDPLEKAANTVVHETLKKAGGSGGLIALDAKGNFALPFNTSGMYRGWIRSDGVPQTRIYGEE